MDAGFPLSAAPRLAACLLMATAAFMAPRPPTATAEGHTPTVAAAPGAPVLLSPANYARLSSLGTTVTWTNPPGAAQVQLR